MVINFCLKVDKFFPELHEVLIPLPVDLASLNRLFYRASGLGFMTERGFLDLCAGDFSVLTIRPAPAEGVLVRVSAGENQKQSVGCRTSEVNTSAADIRRLVVYWSIR